MDERKGGGIRQHVLRGEIGMLVSPPQGLAESFLGCAGRVVAAVPGVAL